jgi:hypothetical protein
MSIANKTKLIIRAKLAQTCLIIMKLGPAFVPQEISHLAPFLKCHSHHVTEVRIRGS